MGQYKIWKEENRSMHTMFLEHTASLGKKKTL